VVSNFIIQALTGEPLTVYGDGSQTRSLCYVDDTIRGLVSVLDSDIEGPVNIGNPNETSVLELAQLVLDVVGSDSEVVFLELPQDDPRRRCPDVSLAARSLGWTPQVDLRTGLIRTATELQKAIGGVTAGTFNSENTKKSAEGSGTGQWA
jgi:nucleoside-diphosphate-sugar epimerase